MADSTKSKAELIEERQANLPLPDDPPATSDFNSADERTVNVGSGGVSDDLSRGGSGGESGLRNPATASSSVRVDGDEYMTNTAGQRVGRGDPESGLPSDAVSQGYKDSSRVAQTENPDYRGDPTTIPADQSQRGGDPDNTVLNKAGSKVHGSD